METLNLQALIKGDGDKSNLRLQAGDTLIVPENRNRVVVIGEVVRQGEQPLEGADTVLDLLVRAGGPTGSAQLSKATLMRRNKAGPPEIIPVDLKKLTTKSNQEALVVNSGDLLFIPPRNQSNRAGLINYLSPLSLLFNAFGF
jgi:protein involved in polysaccharide export with SLBB domain